MAVERAIVVRDEGLVDYASAYALQLKLVEEKKHSVDTDDTLILLEHPDVYTYGRKSKEPAPLGDNVFSVERGGEATYHNPGQLVCYPILYLGEQDRDIHLHLRRLESTLIDVLDDFGLSGERRAGATGVWLMGREKKIASIGVAVSGWVTFHGCALNVNNDLYGFSRIHPCGFSSEVMTSMRKELGDSCPTLAQVKASFLGHFSRHFARPRVATDLTTG